MAFEISLNLLGWLGRLLTTLVLLGFPIALILEWAFELTPGGLKRTEVGDRRRPEPAARDESWESR